ncbi:MULTISPECIES: glycosyltransferase family 2 protein [Rhizobium]|uniref:Glycosyltransferase involved in cell wall biosynthesis n=1 Tax=Rhizobium lentis TaxID=1138194 RepID=A0A7W8XBT6_9HYPH|nr:MULTISPECIES: glycosyltransferase family 2 protein [Rhizobium]MBB4571985.1 glycosyltransferase involved in cell wall biosynthesis [Rhizobium lentis]MBB5548823.1 glycosyltransferase involved in cell wall biosynthesis [Rhizobium lentis]MBB5559355.1 glycosyltransferase involved in cell wall biosynthesis [Rhizobium lentis]MBB5565122.1 glycosyltransferase involved in cell wall biosynthesis [Rhizobium lentis]MEB3047742.1 glycosyltransferase family 2 protein [Rhizobium sp. MJ21]
MKLSVLINNFNYGCFLRPCIDSVLSQTYPDFEVIVVDDGSTDDSREILGSYGEQILPVLKENGGQASSFNAGFAAASGDILFLLDADDAFLPGKLARIAEIYDRNEIDWCFDRVTTAEGDQPPPAELLVTLFDKRETLRKGGFPSLPVPTSGLSFRRALLSQILPMSVATDVVLSDNYIKFAAAYLGRGAIVETPLTFQRIHASNRYTGTSRAKTLRPRIMIATGLELARRYDGLQALGKSLVAGGIAQTTSLLKLSSEARNIVAGGPFGQDAATEVALMAARKRLGHMLRGGQS